jgi:asparaginyl-tRNA synthetase
LCDARRFFIDVIHNSFGVINNRHRTEMAATSAEIAEIAAKSISKSISKSFDEKASEKPRGADDEKKDEPGFQSFQSASSVLATATKRVLIEDLSEKMAGESVVIRGWIDKIRGGAKKALFYTIREGPMHKVQVVVPVAVLEKLDEKSPTPESYVSITGIVQKLPPKAKSFLPVEIQAYAVDVLSRADSDYPHRCPAGVGDDVRGPKYALRHLYMRDDKFAVDQDLVVAYVDSLRAFFNSDKMKEVFVPSFTSMQCEGGATLFELQHPGASTDKPMTIYANQSAQFYLEFALPSRGGSGTFCVAESYRKENSHTRRHLTSFLHAESEWKDSETIEQHKAKLTAMMKGSLTRFLRRAEIPLKHSGKYDSVKAKLKMFDDVLILHHKDAIAMLRELGIKKSVERDGEKVEVDFDDRDDIEEAQERQLTDKIGKVIYLWGFPREHKSFYMALDPKDKSRVLGIDVLVPGVGEIIGSGVRVSTVDELTARLKEQGLDPKDYEAYIDLRRYGFAGTSGMGLGVGRVMTWLLDKHSIREVVAFPRFPGYAAP